MMWLDLTLTEEPEHHDRLHFLAAHPCLHHAGGLGEDGGFPAAGLSVHNHGLPGRWGGTEGSYGHALSGFRAYRGPL